MLIPSSLASSHSYRTTSCLQKFVPRVASAIVIRPWSSLRYWLRISAGGSPSIRSTLPP